MQSEILNHPVVTALRKQRNDLADIIALMAAENASLRTRLEAATVPAEAARPAETVGQET